MFNTLWQFIESSPCPEWTCGLIHGLFFGLILLIVTIIILKKA